MQLFDPVSQEPSSTEEQTSHVVLEEAKQRFPLTLQSQIQRSLLRQKGTVMLLKMRLLSDHIWLIEVRDLMHQFGHIDLDSRAKGMIRTAYIS
jgi:hypothetical protein